MKKMKANGKFGEDEEAVSAVIGVILMVAITVVLAAVIGAFVFGIAPPEPAPDLRFVGVAANHTTDNITMTPIGTAMPMNVTDLVVVVNDVHIPSGRVTPTDIMVGMTVTINASALAPFGLGASVRVIITHLPTGHLMLDTTVTAGA